VRPYFSDFLQDISPAAIRARDRAEGDVPSSGSVFTTLCSDMLFPSGDSEDAAAAAAAGGTPVANVRERKRGLATAGWERILLMPKERLRRGLAAPTLDRCWTSLA
jgi:hypothetical protein